MIDVVPLLIRVLAPDAASDAFNDWQLVFLSSLSRGMRIGLVVLLLVALVLTATGLSRATRRQRWLLLGLRALVGLVVLVLVLMPAIELRAVSRVRSRVAVLVDDSRSMGLPTKKGTRADLVENHITSHQATFERLRKRASLDVVRFAERLEPAAGLGIELAAAGSRSGISRALVDTAHPAAARDLGAIVLYSDGADTEGLTPDRAASLAERLGVPIYAIGFSPESALQDLAIRRIIADDFAFLHNTVTIDVDLEKRGLKVGQTLVTLRSGDEVVGSKEARFDSDGRARVTFDFKPTRIGKSVYQVSIPVEEGEAVVENNAKSIVLKVIRDRIRVLQVAGRPSWDERFLREFLKRSPNVDLISFFILRTPTDQQVVPQDELALIPFPVQELFTDELKSFDLVIYQNFNYRPYRMRFFLRNIQGYVEQGGSFVMIGGDQTFDDGFYAETPIASIVPIRLGSGRPWELGEFHPRLTPEGRRHPITRIGEPGEPPEAAYQRLPPLEGINHSLGLAPGAQALLVHPSLPANPPILAIREVGQGRTMAITTDSMWSWRFVAAGEGGAGREFDRFWNNALRWLTKDPELAQVRIRPEHAVVPSGDPVSAEVRVLGPDYRGLAGAQIDAELLRLGRSEVIARKSLQSGPDGTSVVSFDRVDPGAYTLRVSAHAEGERVGAAEEPIIVESMDLELEAPWPRQDILEALAEGSGGAYFDIQDAMDDIEVKDPRRVEVNRKRQVPVWDTFLAFSVLFVLVGGEWWIRRRAGLL